MLPVKIKDVFSINIFGSDQKSGRAEFLNIKKLFYF